MTQHKTIDGYVAGSSYPANFPLHFQPSWTDALLLLDGRPPPRAPRAPFSYVDLGCGDGLGLIVAAASYPEGRFVGIDAMPEHIARGRALIERLALPNIELRQATFQEALALPSFAADYVCAQGVLAWVSPENQQALIDLAAQQLRPGGVFSVGYNAMPGWAWLMPFQRLVAALAEELSGTPAERFEQARALALATGTLDAQITTLFDERLQGLPADYFAHEYLNAHWNPLWCSDVLNTMAAAGLEHIAEGSPQCLREDFALQAKWRSALADIASPIARTLAIDLLINRTFRVDVFCNGPMATISDEARSAGRLAAYWYAAQPADQVDYALATPGGKLKFDNEAARAIMAHLQQGPMPLGAVPDMLPVDLLNTVDAMWMAGLITPAEPPTGVPHAVATNAALRSMAASETPMNALAGRHGGIAIARESMRMRLPPTTLRRIGVPE